MMIPYSDAMGEGKITIQFHTQRAQAGWIDNQ